jgi:hypothetical protein
MEAFVIIMVSLALLAGLLAKSMRETRRRGRQRLTSIQNRLEIIGLRSTTRESPLVSVILNRL